MATRDGRTAGGIAHGRLLGRPAPRAGFTLVEMTAVIAIVVLLAGIAMPNLLARRATREVTAFFVAVPDLAVFARERAQRDGRTVRIVFDDSRQVLSVETQSDAAEATDEQETSSLRDLPLPEEVQATNFRSEDNAVPSGDWALVFYPDGRSDGGAIEFDDSGRIRSLNVTPDGVARTSEGPLPSVDERRWPAGEREQRA